MAKLKYIGSLIGINLVMFGLIYLSYTAKGFFMILGYACFLAGCLPVAWSVANIFSKRSHVLIALGVLIAVLIPLYVHVYRQQYTWVTFSLCHTLLINVPGFIISLGSYSKSVEEFIRERIHKETIE